MGAAHNTCNLGRVVCKKIPIYCHNFTGYDSHLLVKALSKDDRIKTMSALPRNTEGFRMLKINSYNFMDSLAFMNGGLAAIVDDLFKSGHDFPLLRMSNMYTDTTQRELLLKKGTPICLMIFMILTECFNLISGVFPYEFAQSYSQLLTTTSLPSKQMFYSKISNADISDDNYEHAKNVFDTFECRNMIEYCELYCLLDVVLLAECFTSFREEVRKELGLDCW